MYNNIITKLNCLIPTKLEIIDDTHKHANHLPPNTKETHFTIIIASPLFNGMTKIEMHKTIYKIFDYELKHNILHALSIQTFASNENI